MLSGDLPHIAGDAARIARRTATAHRRRRPVMADFTLDTGTAAPRIEGRFAAALRRWWNGLDERRRIRLTMHALRGLNDRTLKDIGLERGDIESAVRARLLGK
jgi:uncharacterized protein YjiS (DUF1127 family)